MLTRLLGPRYRVHAVIKGGDRRAALGPREVRARTAASALIKFTAREADHFGWAWVREAMAEVYLGDQIVLTAVWPENAASWKIVR